MSRIASPHIVIPVLIAVAAFSFHLAVELKIDSLEGFVGLNTFFAADPNKVLEALSQGTGRQLVAHPNLPHFFSLPIKAIVEVARFVSPRELDRDGLRRFLALLVVPAAAALQCAVVFRIFIRLRFPILLASLLTLLGWLSFSQMIFGSLPESFCLSGLAIGLSYLLFLRSPPEESRLNTLSWGALGVFAAGVTVTNLLPVALLYLMTERSRGRSLLDALRRTAFTALAVLIVVFSSRAILNTATRVPPSPTVERSYVGSYLVAYPHRHAMVFPAAVVNGLAARGGVCVAPNRTISTTGFPFKFTAQTARPLSPRNLFGVALIAFLAIAVFKRSSSRESLKQLSVASLMILGFNWVLHSFWGWDQFLYSQHWHVPLLVLIASLITAYDRLRRLAVPVVAASLLYIVISNALLLRKMITAVQGWVAMGLPF